MSLKDCPKRVVMYTAVDSTSKITGGIRRFFEIVLQLLGRGVEVHLFIPQGVEYFDNNEYLKIHHIKSYHSKILPNGLLNFICNYRKLLSIRRIKYDAVIVFEIPYGIQCILLGFSKTVVFLRQDIIKCRDLHYNEKNCPIILRNIFKYVYLSILILVERYVLLNAHRVVVQSEFEKRNLIDRHFSVREKIKDKFKIIHNNVNSSWIITGIQSQQSNQNNNDLIKLCFIGNIDDQRKGLHILLEAIKFLLEKKYKIELIVMGSGKKLKEYILKYNSYPEIKFIGYIENPHQYLSGCDLLVVPSLADSFPNVILEGFALGIPVIGSNRGGIPEMLKYSELMFEPDKFSLANKIAEVINRNLFDKYQELVKIRNQYFTFDWIGEVIKVIM